MQKELPADNIYPPSLYLIEQIMGVPSLEEVIHVCVNEDFTWPNIPRSQWQAHARDACPHCASSRFMADARGRLQPQKVFYYFGIMCDIALPEHSINFPHACARPINLPCVARCSTCQCVQLRICLRRALAPRRAAPFLILL